LRKSASNQRKKPAKKFDKKSAKKLTQKPAIKLVKKMEKASDQKLDKKTIGRFRKVLLKEREQIIGDVKQIYESSQEMGQDGTQDIADEAANIYNEQILLTLNENERMRLRDVDESLDRIENGTYGVCEDCGEPIGLKRLEVKPVAKYCVPCKTKLEKGTL